MPVVQDDDSKSGFVSTIILKFSQIGNQHTYKDQNKVSCPRHPTYVSKMVKKGIAASSDVQGTFKVDGDVSVQDRIKAYAQLTGAVGAAGWGKNAQEEKQQLTNLSRTESSYKLKPISITVGRSSVANKFLESVNKKTSKKESLLQQKKKLDVPVRGHSRGIVEQFSRISMDSGSGRTSPVQTKPKVPVKPLEKPVVAKVHKAASSSVSTSDSDLDPEIDRVQEYSFQGDQDDDVKVDTAKKSSQESLPVRKSETLNIRSASSSSIDEILNELENESKGLQMIDYSQDSGYHPLPKSYIREYTSNGFSLILPKPKKSIIQKDGSSTRKRITFCNDPITFMETYSVHEYERGDDTIDPLTASAEWEIEKKTDALEKFEVEFTKDNRGLGLSIVGIGLGSESGTEKLGIYIKGLTANGAAEKTGLLRVHDQILEVGGVSLVGVTQSFAAQTLKSTGTNVKFLIGREKQPEENTK